MTAYTDDLNCRAVRDRIVECLDAKLDESGLDHFVVGISGGVDSALTSTLCAETGRSTHVLHLPIGDVTEDDHRAADHMQWLRDRYDHVTGDVVRLDEFNEGLFESFSGTRYDAEYGLDQGGLVEANAQSRERMTTLYAVANLIGGLVVGTGNEVEDKGVGFFTKYGDGGVDVSPIVNLNKTEVWTMSRWLDIDEDIVEAEPTDRLWPDNRSDEHQLGMSYPEIETFMAWYDDGVDPSNVDDARRDAYETFIEQHESTRHKMSMPDECKLEDVKYE